MRQAIIFTAIVVTGAVLGANVYNSAVDTPNWGAQIPASIENARRYFSVRNPGTFFRVASPLAQVLSLLVLVVVWRLGGPTRGLAALALGLGVLADLFTFAYFYPRNDVMFVQPARGSLTSRLGPRAAADRLRPVPSRRAAAATAVRDAIDEMTTNAVGICRQVGRVSMAVVPRSPVPR